jgi:hypothetical protein
MIIYTNNFVAGFSSSILKKAAVKTGLRTAKFLVKRRFL